MNQHDPNKPHSIANDPQPPARPEITDFGSGQGLPTHEDPDHDPEYVKSQTEGEWPPDDGGSGSPAADLNTELLEGSGCPKCGQTLSTSGGRHPLRCVSASCRYVPSLDTDYAGDPIDPTGKSYEAREEFENAENFRDPVTDPDTEVRESGPHGPNCTCPPSIKGMGMAVVHLDEVVPGEPSSRPGLPPLASGLTGSTFVMIMVPDSDGKVPSIFNNEFVARITVELNMTDPLSIQAINALTEEGLFEDTMKKAVDAQNKNMMGGLLDRLFGAETTLADTLLNGLFGRGRSQGEGF